MRRICRNLRNLTLAMGVAVIFVGAISSLVPADAAAKTPRTHRVHRPHRPAAPKKRLVHRKIHKTVAHKSGDRIAAFVATVQPKKGPRYARRVARAVRHAAKTTGLSPEVILATGYVESEFRMGAGPCMGVMQVHPGTLREMRRHMPAARNLDPDRVEDNIQLGALELASHYNKGTHIASRSSNERLSRAWGRYNGSSSHSSYVRRVRTVLRRIKKGDSVAWRRHLQKHGTLWNS